MDVRVRVRVRLGDLEGGCIWANLKAEHIRTIEDTVPAAAGVVTSSVHAGAAGVGHGEGLLVPHARPGHERPALPSVDG